MPVIKKISAHEILDSRGNPTVEINLTTAHHTVRASIPSGASTGRHEALEIRDGGKRYGGLGVKKAIANIKKIEKWIKGRPLNQAQIDNLMIAFDGTKNKSKLGANAVLPVSIAVCKAAAAEAKLPLWKYINKSAASKPVLPVPCFNIINGGRHAGNKLDFQEYMLLPTKAKTFAEAFRIGSETYHSLKAVLKRKYGKNAVKVGDEGGFAPPLSNHEQPIELILKAAEKSDCLNKVRIGLDIAASEFYKNKHYHFEGKNRTPAKMLEIYESLAKTYPIISIEDPFDQEAFNDFAELKKILKKKVQIVGDDILTTNPERIRIAVKQNSCSALLLKINQIGTLTESFKAAKLAFMNKWNVMVSHRSGETNDSFIADLAVGIGSGQIKAGAPFREERLAKYNRLLRIEEQSSLKYNRKFFLKW